VSGLSTFESDAVLARAVYSDRVVDKRLAMQEAFARLPRYVTEYLFAKYVRPGHEEQDLRAVKEKLRGRIPEAGEKEIIKSRLMREGSYVVIDQLEADVDLAASRYRAHMNCMDSESIGIRDDVVERFEGLLNGGLWGTVTLGYDASAQADRKITVRDFVPFQVSHVDVQAFKAGRAQFSRDEWIRLLLRSAGYEPDGILQERQRLLLLARLIPLVERNVNLIELGPRGTGKTFLLRNISPATFTISGGRPSPATLFLHKVSHRVGIIGTRKVVVFDEIAATTFPDSEMVATLKDYMESGQFSRGKKVVASDASIVLAGNLDVSGDQPSDAYNHLFEDLPTALIDAAFLDRLHGYLPGWEIPKVSETSLARGVGFVTDYFGEVLKELRSDEFNQHFESLDPGTTATIRDVKGARRIASGLLKLLHPDGRFSEEELRTCLRFGVELRQRVHNQLTHIAPGEFPRRTISFPGMVPHDAKDLKEAQKVQERDVRANREAIVGQVTGLVVLQRGSVTIGGDVFFTEVSMIHGAPGLSITGLRGPVLTDSVTTAHQALQQLSAPWQDVGPRLLDKRVAVHLVNIADPKDGPSAGIAFVTAIVSAALGIPVRAGIAMTGEVTLHGFVGAVGGIPHKIKAAALHHRKLVIIPAQNAADLRDVPDDVLTSVEVKTVSRIEEVLEIALGVPPSGSSSNIHGR
jgi:ATP-dependent Lon protease